MHLAFSCKSFWLWLMLILLAIPGLARAQTALRGWHAHGQTWLVWEETLFKPLTYDIYRSETPISHLEDATLVGRVFPEEYRANRMQLALEGATWIIPDAAGGRYTLKSDEGLFVSTPQNAVPAYFAVVKHGQEQIDEKNTVGPIAQSLDQVTCHRQYKGIVNGYTFTLYALWVDGRDDWDSGRSDYPVMGNAHANGTGHVFAVVEPQNGRPKGKLPASVHLHGNGDQCSWVQLLTRDEFGSRFDEGLLIAPDDVLFVVKAIVGLEFVVATPTRWFGYWSDFNRFTMPEGPPPDDGVVVNYTMRRMDFILDWLVENEDIDPDRISLFGLSGGGDAVSAYIRMKPERFSAGSIYVPSFTGSGIFFSNYLQGEGEQNLATNLPGDMPLMDFWWPTHRLVDGDLPFMRFVIGREDLFTNWSTNVLAFEQIDAARFGAHLYWDEREHVDWGSGGWEDAHWNPSPRIAAADLLRFRNDSSFPAFSNEDQNAQRLGRQPDPGNGEAFHGDPWGTWGGYLDWDPESVVDMPTAWEADLFLVSTSAFANDVPDFDHTQVDVTVRKARQFSPRPQDELTWSLTRIIDGQALQCGNLSVAPDGVVTLRQLTIYKAPARLKIRYRNEDGLTRSDDDEQGPEKDEDVEPVGKTSKNGDDSPTTCCGD